MRGCPKSNGDVQHCRDPFRLLGDGESVAFRLPPECVLPSVIAFKAAGHDVVPGLCATFDNGNDVIECEIFGRALFPAVLACVVIPGIDVCSAEFYVLEMFSDLYIFQAAGGHWAS